MLARMGLIEFFSSQRADRPRSAGDVLWDVAFNPDDEDGVVLGRLELPGFVIWVPVGAVLLWLVSYISGVFPYLGHYQHRSPDEAASYIPTGPTHMLLFEGQEAFIDYEIESAEGYNGDIAIDIRPLPAHRPSPAMQRLNGTDRGTLKVTIPATGVYRFHHQAEQGSHRKGLSYSVTWGAR